MFWTTCCCHPSEILSSYVLLLENIILVRWFLRAFTLPYGPRCYKNPISGVLHSQELTAIPVWKDINILLRSTVMVCV